MLLIGIFPADLRDVPQSGVELVGNSVGLVQGTRKIVRRQDELHFEAADAVADVKHAFPQGKVGRFFAIENGVQIVPVHYAPVADQGLKTVTGATI